MAGFSWHKRAHAEMLDVSRCLTPEQAGFLFPFMDLFCTRLGDVPDDDRQVASFLNRDIRQWRRVKSELLALDHLEVRDGRLYNSIAERELHDGLRRMQAGSRGGRASGQARLQAKLPQSYRTNAR